MLNVERYRRQQNRRHLLQAKFHTKKLPSQIMYVFDNNLFLSVLLMYGNDSRLFSCVNLSLVCCRAAGKQCMRGFNSKIYVVQ